MREVKNESKNNLDILEEEIKKDLDNTKPIKLPVLIFLLIISIISFILLNISIPSITLNGKSIIEIEYNSKYIEEGAKSYLFNRNLTNKIEISGNVDTSKIGSYTITYQLKDTIFHITKERTVNVVDKTSPTITLDGDDVVNICPNTTYSEIGYTAFDEYDGNLTDNVTITQNKTKIIYKVSDSSGNTTTVTREIIEKDDTSPTITLKGNTTMYLGLNDTFTEPGYTASDNCSSDLTDKVEITGEVDTSKEGEYSLTYTVNDDSNNTTSVTRKIVVSIKTNVNSGTIKKGVIYLTFDDGPSATTTATILDILKEENVKATFFVTNNGPDSLIKRMYDEGHTVALHTASHNYATVYASDEAYFADLKIVSDRVKRITGQTSKIVRFPGGSSNTVSRRYNEGIMTRLTTALLNQGYRYYDWNVDSDDAGSAKTKEQVYKNVVNNLSKNRSNVVLMHDIKTATRDALSDIIKYAKENGYTFERIDMDTYMVRQRINN